MKTLITILITFVLSSNNFALGSGVYIYFIQVVDYRSNPATGWKKLGFRKPDFSTFITRKDCENELLRAISEPDSSVAKENGLVGEYVVRRGEYTNYLEVISDGGVMGYQKGRCVSKYLSPYDVKKIKKEWEKLNGKKLKD